MRFKIGDIVKHHHNPTFLFSRPETDGAIGTILRCVWQLPNNSTNIWEVQFKDVESWYSVDEHCLELVSKGKKTYDI